MNKGSRTEENVVPETLEIYSKAMSLFYAIGYSYDLLFWYFHFVVYKAIKNKNRCYTK